MNDITGYYSLSDGGAQPPIQLTINSVDASGQIVGSLDSNNNIHGHYNDATRQIIFTTQNPKFPLRVLIDFYAGVVVFDNKGLPSFTYGTHHHFGNPPDILHGGVTNWAAVFLGQIIG